MPIAENENGELAVKPDPAWSVRLQQAGPSMLRSILSNWMGLVISGAISFALTPILIHGLGEFHYGMWILVASATDYYGLLDLGMRWTLFRFAARFKGANDRAALNQTFVTALALTVGIACLVAGLTLLFILVLPGFFKLAGPARQLFQMLVALLGLSVAVAFPSQLLGSYLCAQRRFDLYNLAVITSSLVRAALIVFVLHRGFGVRSVGMVTLAVALLSLALNAILVRRADPEVSFDCRRTSWLRIRELVSFSFYAFLNMLGDHLRFYTDSIVIGRILGIALITPFSIAARLMYFFRQTMVAVASPLMGRMSELDGRGTEQELRQFFLRATKTTALLSFFLGSLLLLNGRTLIRIWVGDTLLSSYPLIAILTAAYVVALAQEPSAGVMLARARHRLRGWWNVGEGIANLFLSIYWAKKYGLIGIALGTSIPMLIVGIFLMPWYALRVVGIPASTYLRDAVARPAATCALFVGLCSLTRSQQEGSGAIYLMLSIIWQTALYGALSYVIVLTGPERQRLLTRGQGLMGFVHRRGATANIFRDK